MLILSNEGRATLIVTLSIDEQSQAFFDKLRTVHFPAHINYLKAHITLFHRLSAVNSQIKNIIRKYSTGPVFQYKSSVFKIPGMAMHTSLSPEYYQKYTKRCKKN